jgi:two-component system, OmpR family, phosphate regulon sensor histidine kinase PhoR
LLAIPLAVAVWSLGGFAARRVRDDADQRLVPALNRSMDSYQVVSNHAARRASRLANDPSVQRALRRGGRSLARVRAAHPKARFVRGKSPVVRPPGTDSRTVRVATRGETLGRVTVLIRLNHKLISHLSQEGRLRKHQSLVFIHGDLRARHPVDIGQGASRRRIVALQVNQGRPPLQLGVYELKSRINAAANKARWRAIAVGVALIAALLGLAYAVAPAIARTRLSRQQRDQAEQVLANLGDGVVMVDDEGIVRLWNPAAEAITGLRASKVTNHRATDAIPGWKAIAALVPVASGPAHGTEFASVETVPLEVDGHELWLSMVAVALADGTVYAFRDATADRRLEELRSQFVATISHELRTPLASLHGAAVTLREHGDELNEQTQTDLLEMIAQQSKRLADLVEEILVAGQLDSGSLRVRAEPFDPEELVRAAALIAQARLREGTTISVQIEPLLPKVQGDVERTRQVLLNLLDNAVKYSPSGGRIEMRAAPTTGGVRFSVRDEGLGIPLGEQERIFEKFYRLDPDQRGGIGGTGLGLYISRELVRSMGGRIWVESEPGRGTLVSFELPAAAERVPVPA